MVACELTSNEYEMADVEEPFFGLLLVTSLEQWGVEKWNIAQATSSYQNIMSANF